jgi:hypothetical protein
MDGRREQLWRQIQSQNTPTALSALDALDAAFLLLSFGRLAQAVFLFHHSAELAMKGLLESVHIVLTADRPDYELLKMDCQGADREASTRAYLRIPL